MAELAQSWWFTAGALALITVTFAVASRLLSRELDHVRGLADYLSFCLAAADPDPAGEAKPKASTWTERFRDEVIGVLTSSDPAWANKQVRGWQMKAQRLEPALAFWVDLLRQLGLLFTVVGLGLSLAVPGAGVDDLLRPLGLAVWTTVAGLFYSLVLTARFGMTVALWADNCEKNIEAWDHWRRARHAAKGGG
jgi:hypothetical protein